MTNEATIREICTSNPKKGFGLLVKHFQEPIYWHIRRLVVPEDTFAQADTADLSDREAEHRQGPERMEEETRPEAD